MNPGMSSTLPERKTQPRRYTQRTENPPDLSAGSVTARLGASNRLREERNGNYVYLLPGHVIFFRNYNPAE